MNRFLLLLALLVSALFPGPSVHATGLNDTGITTCSNATQNGLPCPVAGFPGQDAEYGTNGFDFTKLDASGNALSASATNHTCVQDNVTGLVWEVKTADGGLRDQRWTYTWYNSSSTDGNLGTASGGTCHDTGRCDTEKFTQDVNAAGLCGFHDWRMPNPKELAGIVDYSIPYPGPTINTGYFPNTPSSAVWSSSPYAYSSGYAWYVYFYNGNVDNYGRSSAFAVRLVRGGQAFVSLSSNADGTVTDNSTGLMWAQCSEGQSGTGCATGSVTNMVWADALTAARNSRLGGYSDWRLPNAKELQSIVDYSVYGPSIDRANFPNTPSSFVWSSSPAAGYSDGAWYVNFGNGAVGYGYGGWSSAFAVRLVRGGQAFVSVSFDLSVTRLFVAMFGRALVAHSSYYWDDLSFWVNALTQGQSIAQVAQSMYDATPARVYYPLSYTNEQIVTSFFTMTYGRAPLSAGLRFWSDMLTADTSYTPQGNLIAAMIDSIVNMPRNSDDQKLFNNRVAMAGYYAVQYHGDSSHATMVVSQVTTDTDVSSDAAIQAFINNLGIQEFG